MRAIVNDDGAPHPVAEAILEREQARTERQAKNAPIQGANADALKLALRRVHDRFRKLNAEAGQTVCGLLFSVQDEIVSWALPDETGTVDTIQQAVVEEMAAAAETVLGRPNDPDGVPVEIHTTIRDTWGG